MAVKRAAEDWAREALTVISESGLDALAVEPLAARLGTTKGSFYWHFATRDALVVAALALWEREHTESIIELVEAQGAGGHAAGPEQRLRELLERVVGYSRHDRIEMTLLACADDPRVGPALQRATRRRVGYVASLYAALGHDPAEAHRRAVVAVSVYLGHLQLAHVSGDLLPVSEAQWRSHLDLVSHTLIPAPD